MPEPIDHALALLKRQATLEAGIRQLGGIRVTEEREQYAVRDQLRRYPEAVAAILQAASNLHRTVDALQVSDIRSLC